jgi:hypothetical protein
MEDLHLSHDLNETIMRIFTKAADVVLGKNKLTQREIHSFKNECLYIQNNTAILDECDRLLSDNTQKDEHEKICTQNLNIIIKSYKNKISVYN